ncbi:MAG: diguanylate cyclase [Desulfotignum sp.]|nr:diguanylate cyclase [Desulfotignum sp.]
MRTLKVKISILVICLVVGAQLATGLPIASQVKEAMHQENHRRGLAVANDLAHVSARALISRDLAELRTYIQYALAQQYVTQAMVVDKDCRIIMHNTLAKVGEQYAGTCPQQRQSLFSEHYTNETGEKVIDVLVPIEPAGAQLGTAILSYSHTGIANEIKLLTRKIFLVLLIGSIFSVLFAIVLAEYIARPIRHLSRVAEELGSGLFDVKKMDTEYNDEIGDLARSFYDMAVKLEKEVCHDTLTGLYTRNIFQIRLDDAHAHSLRHNNFLFAVLMLDVDHFKKVNDTYGHKVGDDVLRHIAAILTEQIRGGDCLARYGGEEFVMLLPETHRQGSLHVAEKIRRRVAADSFRMADDCKILLSISIGIALFPEDTSDHTCLLELADQAMYEAKKSGRNTVFQASDLKRC